MLALNSAALVVEFTFQVRRNGCMSESNTTCVVRVGGGFSVVPVVGVGIISVIGVVGVEVFRKEFWASLCIEALLLCSLLGCCIVAFSMELFDVLWKYFPMLCCVLLFLLLYGP